MGKEPFVACICRTYGRLSESFDHTCVINEAVESFLRQDYKNKRLLLINDTPGQRIIFDHPDVKIINSPTRYDSIATKINLGIKQALGCKYVFVWDDDDISLPWRLSQMVETHEQGTHGCNYVGEGTYWVSMHNRDYMLENNLHTGITASASFRRKTALEFPYPNVVGEDYAFYELLQREKQGVIGVARDPRRASFIYRWGYLVRHVSGYPKADGYERLGEDTYPPAEIVVEPSWAYDYVDFTQKLIDTVNFIDKRK